MGIVETLCRLQAVDQEWDEKGRIFQQVRQRLTDTSELDRRRQALQAFQQERAHVRGALRDAELRLETLQQKAKAVEHDLYSGRTTSPRELENLQQEREMLRRQISETEDEVLMGLTRAEELDEAISSATQELDRLEAAWARERQLLQEQYRELGMRLQHLQRERERLRAEVGRPELALYDELRKSKGGQALARMDGGTCLTCRVTVPSHKAQMVQVGQTLVLCDGCGRILCLA